MKGGHIITIAAIANPYAGRGRNRKFAEQLHRRATELGLPMELHWTKGAGDGIDLAKKLSRSHDVICAIGGDGTFHEVINGLMPQPKPVVLVPAGSGNDFAKLIPCPKNAEELLTVVHAGMGARMDVLQTGVRYCVNSIGLGFEALVTHHSRSIRRLSGVPLYLLAAFRALLSFQNASFNISLDNCKQVSGERLLVSIGNGISAGGGFYLTPQACPDNGCVDLCIVSPMSRMKLLRLLPLALHGNHVGKTGVAMHRSKSVTVSSDGPSHLHIDGEYLGEKEWNLDVTVLKQILPVLCLTQGSRKTQGDLEKLL
ncbi:MAG: YegS/Rv2252/BmrU family lipid kinase [Candidatus Latescibacterota bacterium]